MDKTRDESGDGRHPIKVVSRRTGLSPDVIRVWERRYHAVEPERSGGGSRRLYSDDQIERLRLLRRATLGGRRISELAGLSTADLERMVAEDESAGGTVPALRPEPTPGQGTSILEGCQDAIRELDARGLMQQLARGTVELSPHEFLNALVLPLLRWVGDEWRAGRIRTAHEHLATSIIRSIAHTMHSDRDLSSRAPEIVIATLEGQHHEMGALLASVIASTEGWRTTYLGTSLPTDDLAAAVRQRQARVLALSVVYPVDDPELPEQLRRLRRLVGSDVQILVGGRAAEAYRPALARIDGRFIESYEDFRNELERIRYE